MKKNFFFEIWEETINLFKLLKKPSSWAWIFGFVFSCFLGWLFFQKTIKFDPVLKMLHAQNICYMDLNNRQAASLVVLYFVMSCAFVFSLGEIMNSLERKKRGLKQTSSLYWTLGVSSTCVIATFIFLKTLPC